MPSETQFEWGYLPNSNLEYAFIPRIPSLYKGNKGERAIVEKFTEIYFDGEQPSAYSQLTSLLRSLNQLDANLSLLLWPSRRLNYQPLCLKHFISNTLFGGSLFPPL